MAMNIDSGDATLVLLCPAWKRWGTARTVKPGTVILHSRADDVVPFTDSEELVSEQRAASIGVDRGRHGPSVGRPGAAGADAEGVRGGSGSIGTGGVTDELCSMEGFGGDH